MTVRELIKELEQCPLDEDIYLEDWSEQYCDPKLLEKDCIGRLPIRDKGNCLVIG